MKVIQSGSNRIFLVIHNKVVLIDPDKQSLINYIKILKFLQKNSINVPKLYLPKLKNLNENIYFAVIQNLGENFFNSLQKKGFRITEDWLTNKYYQIVKEISKIHNVKKKSIIYGGLFSFFDLDLLRWEWKYFIENFLINYLGYVKINRWLNYSEVVISNCFNVFKEHFNLIHRDLQSTNIIFYKNKPYFIDFQGMKIGNFLYDLASLVEDPYVLLPLKIKNSVIDFYFKINSHLSKFGYFYRYYKIQRLVQVLGAFAFLSIHKNKPFFIQQLKKYNSILQEIKKELTLI